MYFILLSKDSRIPQLVELKIFLGKLIMLRWAWIIEPSMKLFFTKALDAVVPLGTSSRFAVVTMPEHWVRPPCQ